MTRLKSDLFIAFHYCEIADCLFRLVFRWLAIPWIQAEIDKWMKRFNESPRHADKHKLLPAGIPDLIASKPHLYHASDYKVVYPLKYGCS